ncbi:MAG: hypothetical protein COT81_05790 [Candidatus Buchananbacteria bacterium CG10_big_fil_rev_8_21_14_0_10_42_9]|uniref:RNA polymerase subunit sigma-24 n=1 Tax=Candidatus Buchananbacteria bacterium CG10_big_fil_rev_8_21_14_0_10_42_9 TaxID=1974526 RepID=A0A2H0W1S7_9BACT|nr:MAG: hypothetical protein COT81_05790 [Candidatus Buchananbacteria bacterium CG10_big_fil_rev_8_21_14_0_10_42_9]
MTGNFNTDPADLMERAKQGDSDAFGQLYELYYVPVFRYIYYRLPDKEEAENLTQTVFIKVFKSVGRFKYQGKSPLAYFFTVARNSITDYWRKKREVKLNDPEVVFQRMADDRRSEAELTEIKDMATKIKDAIYNLTEEQQEVMILKFVNEFSNKEIAEVTGKKEGAIRQLQCRALKVLRQEFKDAY